MLTPSTKPHWLLILLLLALTLPGSFGCSGGRQDSPSPGRQDGESPLLTELRQNERRWSDQQIRSYRFVLQSMHFGGPDTTLPVIIEVTEGTRSSIRPVSEGSPVNTEYFSRYDTVEKLFDTIRSAIESGAESTEVTYDENLGHPRQIAIDYNRIVADEGFSLEVSEFQSLP